MEKVNPERAKMIKDLQDEKAKYEAELRSDPTDKAAQMNLKQVNSVLKRYGVNIDEDNSKLKDGGMAGGKRTPHMYVGGGAVVDNLPNEGLKELVKSGPAGKKAVRNRGFDV